MNTEAQDVSDAPREPQPAPAAPTRPLYWSVRRELWENRSIYVVPASAAALVLFGFALSSISLPRRMRALLELAEEPQRLAVAMPYSIAASLIIVAAYIAGAFYCLDALYGERRDRSLLFWKSLPVSDLTTVLSKVCVPLVVVPAVAFGVGLATQLAMLAWSTVVLLATGAGVTTLWTRLSLVEMTLIMIYGLTVHALWHAPVYAWLLLVSGWSRRTPFLWAVLPLAALGIFERIVFSTSYFGAFLRYRLAGAMSVAFALNGREDVMHLSELSPLRFLTSFGLWSGLAVAAGLIAAAARMRRSKEPL